MHTPSPGSRRPHVSVNRPPATWLRPTPPLPAAAALLATVLALAAAVLAGCAAKQPTTPPPSQTTLPRLDARAELAGRAAGAKDQRYVATYRYSVPGRDDRTVTVAYATDGSWAVSIPAGALGGYANIAVLGVDETTYECALGPAGAATGTGWPSVEPACVTVEHFGSGTDPRVQHLFTDWIDPLADRDSALSAIRVAPFKDASGTCYSVEPNSAALASPVDPGIYCYDAGGTLTAAKLDFGTLVLAEPVASAPATVTLPAPVVAGSPWSLRAPPSPTPNTPSASAAPAALAVVGGQIHDRACTQPPRWGYAATRHAVCASPSAPRRGPSGRHLVAGMTHAAA